MFKRSRFFLIPHRLYLIPHRSSLIPHRSYLIPFCLTVLISCTSQRAYKTSVVTDTNLHSNYDDTTLLVDNTSVLMPYNRFIDPAGTVIRFGNPSLENHSLDCALVPDQNVLVVEDRYGLAFIDVVNKRLSYHLDYSGSYSGMMS